jgi:phosphohistidine swiveling domain-containing protein
MTRAPVNLKEFRDWVEHGNFWFEEAPILPITVELFQRNMVKTHEWFPPGALFSAFIYERDHVRQVLSVSESVETSKNQFEEVRKESEKITTFYASWKKSVDGIEKELKELERIDLTSLSQKELLKRFEKVNKVVNQFGYVTLVLEPTKAYVDPVYYPIFEKKVGNQKRARDAYGIITLPSKQSFITEEKKSMLKIALAHFKKDHERREFLNINSSHLMGELKASKPALLHDLEQHQKSYYWMQNSYAEWTVLSVNDFAGFLQDMLKSMDVKQLQNELKRLEDTQSLISRQQATIKKLALSLEMVRELEYIRETTWLFDDRKRIILKWLHWEFAFLEEFSRRSGIDARLMGYALIEEIPSILNKQFSASTLEERRNLCIFVTQKGNKYSMLSGKEALQFQEALLKRETTDSSRGILGNVACQGPETIVRGKARIIFNSKGQTIGKNEILVTSMTRPDFLPLMKAAKAIVTNEGGITSHAAIVSREMNKACIIATTYATDILKDGDEIELRMNHGWVRIIKRKEGNG